MVLLRRKWRNYFLKTQCDATRSFPGTVLKRTGVKGRQQTHQVSNQKSLITASRGRNPNLGKRAFKTSCFFKSQAIWFTPWNEALLPLSKSLEPEPPFISGRAFLSTVGSRGSLVPAVCQRSLARDCSSEHAHGCTQTHTEAHRHTRHMDTHGHTQMHMTHRHTWMYTDTQTHTDAHRHTDTHGQTRTSPPAASEGPVVQPVLLNPWRCFGAHFCLDVSQTGAAERPTHCD